ncbi:MAG: lysine--tRNA ligase, partial [Candidatus Aminicenantes bacterium]|nr:lysine--tRNA ligase [Candidatus Aminicenantes bacterium]
MSDQKEEKKDLREASVQSERSDQELARDVKLEKLIQQGIDLFPHKVDVTHSVTEIVSQNTSKKKEDLEEQPSEVFVPGRILSIRRMGRATFFHISDGRNKLQVYLRADKIGQELYDRFS